MNASRLAVGCAALLFAAPRAASGQEVGVTPGTAAAQSPSQAAAPRYAIYQNAETGTFVKPILGFSGGLHYELQRNSFAGVDEKLDPIATTLAVALFGVEGRIGQWASFHAELRRDPGYYGTSVWEGTISLTAMDNYVKFERWGASLAGGIVTDPASVDYFSAHMADLFMADTYSRTTLLHSGFNRGQGIVGQYRWNGLTAGLAFSAGNPLATSTSFGFGGKVSPMGTLIEYPRRSITNGNPVSGIELDVLAPSLSFESRWVDAKFNFQQYLVNVNTESQDDVGLGGQLYRFSLRGKLGLAGGYLIPFGNLAWRRNDMILQSTGNPDPTKLDPDEYAATVVSGGIDYNLPSGTGIGVNYGMVEAKAGALPTSRQHYLNVGASWWFYESASLGVRYAKSITQTEDTTTGGLDTEDGIKDKDSFFIAVRLVI